MRRPYRGTEQVESIRVWFWTGVAYNVAGGDEPFGPVVAASGR